MCRYPMIFEAVKRTHALTKKRYLSAAPHLSRHLSCAASSSGDVFDLEFHFLDLDLLVWCLEKVKKHSPKWWFDGDLPWYEVKNHLNKIQVDLKQIPVMTPNPCYNPCYNNHLLRHFTNFQTGHPTGIPSVIFLDPKLDSLKYLSNGHKTL